MQFDVALRPCGGDARRAARARACRRSDRVARRGHASLRRTRYRRSRRDAARCDRARGRARGRHAGRRDPERTLDARLCDAREPARDVADARRSWPKLAGGGIAVDRADGDDARRHGPRSSARRDRQRRRVRQRAGTRAARTARRLRGPLVQGPAEHVTRRHDASRRSASATIRATRSAANTTRRSTRCRPERASGRRVRAGARSCARCARTSPSRYPRQRRHAFAQAARRRVRRDRAGVRPDSSGSDLAATQHRAVPARRARAGRRAGGARRSRCAPAIRASGACATLLNDPQTEIAVRAERAFLRDPARRLPSAGRRARPFATANICSSTRRSPPPTVRRSCAATGA